MRKGVNYVGSSWQPISLDGRIVCGAAKRGFSLHQLDFELSRHLDGQSIHLLAT